MMDPNQTGEQASIFAQLEAISIPPGSTLEQLLMGLSEQPAPEPEPAPLPLPAPPTMGNKLLRVVSYAEAGDNLRYGCLYEDGTQQTKGRWEIEGGPALLLYRKQLKVEQNRRAYLKRKENKKNKQ